MADAVVSEVSLQVFLSLLHFNRGIFFVFRPYVRDYFPICFAVWFVASLEITAIKFVASFTCVTRIIIWFAVRMAARVAERSGVRIAGWLTVRITNQVTCMITGRVADWVAAWFAVRIAERVTDQLLTGLLLGLQSGLLTELLLGWQSGLLTGLSSKSLPGLQAWSTQGFPSLLSLKWYDFSHSSCVPQIKTSIRLANKCCLQNPLFGVHLDNIGEMDRCLHTRKKEHIRNTKVFKTGSNIASHAWLKDHTIDFENACVIDRGNSCVSKTLESWHTAITRQADNNSKQLPRQYSILL